MGEKRDLGKWSSKIEGDYRNAAQLSVSVVKDKQVEGPFQTGTLVKSNDSISKSSHCVTNDCECLLASHLLQLETKSALLFFLTESLLPCL